MKTLYIHGLDSFPRPEKIDILKKAGLDTVALHLDYRQQLGVYQILKENAIQKNVEYIIGSSLGGLLGYLLSEDLGLPCLLFNPAMEVLRQKAVYYNQIPEITEKNCTVRYVVLGAKDETVSHKTSQDCFCQRERDGLHQRVITCDWLGHTIDLNTFYDMVNWATNSIRNLSKKG